MTAAPAELHATGGCLGWAAAGEFLATVAAFADRHDVDYGDALVAAARIVSNRTPEAPRD